MGGGARFRVDWDGGITLQLQNVLYDERITYRLQDIEKVSF